MRTDSELMTEAKETAEKLKSAIEPILIQIVFSRLNRHYMAHTIEEFKELDYMEDHFESLINQLLGFTMPYHLR